MGIEKSVDRLPCAPGVYLFLGKEREVLYVGKASHLKKRVRSYFRKGYHPPKIASLIRSIRDLDYITTSSSAEALIYEASLIKKLKPKYNSELKDDKSYPFLKLTTNEPFPRLVIARGKKDDGAVYYGPYTNSKLLRKALALIKGIFLLRSCTHLPGKACLKAHIRQCSAPCDGRIGPDEYAKVVDEVRLFLDGKKEDLIKKLSGQMREASTHEEYEKALTLRDRIEALSIMWKRRKPPSPLNREVNELKEALGLTVIPARIEAFDISNIHGKEAVGSLVSFFSGRPQRDEYRRFRIKDISGIDDYGMIREVMRRRYSRILREKARYPDLILIDGGKGHLAVARDELNKIKGAPKIPIISIAKERELLYTEKRAKPLRLSRRSPALKLIMRIRDEAHRFAISYHKLLREKYLLRSLLDDIPGVGEKRKKALITYFGSVDRIRRARIRELANVKGMSEALAKTIRAYCKQK
jgi:excinuclease ABC subunit C